MFRPPARLGAHAYYNAIRSFRVAALRRRFRNAAVVLCYHNIIGANDDAVGDGSLHLRADRFARQMEWLASHYDVVPLRDLVRRIGDRARLRSVAAITFDDGYAGVFAHAVPILRMLRLPATVFVVSDAPGRLDGFWWDHPDICLVASETNRKRWLGELQGDTDAIRGATRVSGVGRLPAVYRPADWSTIAASLPFGIDIGVHSATHRSLPTLDGTELDREIVESRDAIGRAIGQRPDTFAYPYGLVSDAVRERVRSAGYRAAFSLRSSLNDADADLWTLGRINIPGGISDSAFEAWSAGLHPPKRS